MRMCWFRLRATAAERKEVQIKSKQAPSSDQGAAMCRGRRHDGYHHQRHRDDEAGDGDPFASHRHPINGFFSIGNLLLTVSQ